MAVNFIGQNIQLLLNPAQRSDISQGLQVGDAVQARVLDLLPDNRAVIQLNGMNLLASLPSAQGQSLSRGSVLELAVLQAQNQASQPAATGTGGATASGPALSLKLLNVVQPGASNNLLSAQAQPQELAATLPRPSLENILAQAQLPATPANLQAAQSLNRYGLPLDKATLQTVVKSAEVMIGAENLPSQSSTQAPSLPPGLNQSLSDAKTLLTILSNQAGPDRPTLQNLLKQVDAIQNQAEPSQASQPQAPASRPILTATAQMPSQQLSLDSLKAALDLSVTQASDAKPGSLQAMGQALNQVEAALPQIASVQVQSAAPQALEPAKETHPQVLDSLSTEVSASLVHEAASQIALQGPLTQDGLQAIFSTLQEKISVPQSRAAELLFQSAKTQLESQAAKPPQEQDSVPSPVQEVPLALQELETDPRPALIQALNQFQEAFQSQPLAAPLRSATELSSALEARSLPAPQLPLSNLPKEAVLEAVAFLKARSLPTTRGFVEPVATELGQGRNLGDVLQQISSAQSELPQGLLRFNPSLEQAFQNLSNFLSQNTADPNHSQFWTQLRDFSSQTGLNLEHSLAKPDSAPPGPGPRLSQAPAGPVVDPSETLKAGLLKLRAAVLQASQDPVAQSSGELSGKLGRLAGDVNGALNSLHTMSLAAHPTTAFEVNNIQLPISIGGQMQGGQLSVYWKRGQAKELNASEPVNVVFLLKTRGLGEIKAQLQVWKDDCQCKVTVADPSTKSLLEGAAGDLKSGFESNTRFSLNQFAVDLAGAQSPATLLNEIPSPGPGPGSIALNVTA
jgi:hypothetical protein